VGTQRPVSQVLRGLSPGEGERRASGMAVIVDGATPTTGLRTKLSPDAEIYFAPAIAGGTEP